jgi:hypothetical protein
MGNSDWQFVEKILDLTEGHSNAQRARMIVDVLCQVHQQRQAGHEDVNYPLDCRAWLLATGRPMANVTF